MKKHIHQICVGVILLVAVLACSLRPSEQIPQPETTFTSAVLTVFPEQAVFNGENLPGALYEFCWPPSTGEAGYLQVNEIGELSGRCEGKSNDGTLVRIGGLVGEYEVDYGFVTFEVETINVFTPYPEGKVTSKIVFKVEEEVLKGKSVSGMGEFSYTCNAEGELAYCDVGRKELNTNGTMPFQLDFSP